MTAAPASASLSVSSAIRARGHGRGSLKARIDSASMPTTAMSLLVSAPGKSASVARRWNPAPTSADNAIPATAVTTTVRMSTDTIRRISNRRATPRTLDFALVRARATRLDRAEDRRHHRLVHTRHERQGAHRPGARALATPLHELRLAIGNRPPAHLRAGHGVDRTGGR